MAHCVAQQRVYQSGQPVSSRSPPPSGRGTTPVYTSPQRQRVGSPVPPRRVGVHQVHAQVGQQPQAAQQQQVRQQGGSPIPAAARPVSPRRGSPQRQHSQQQYQHLQQQQQMQQQMHQQRMHHSGPPAVQVQPQPQAQAQAQAQGSPQAQQPQQRRPPSADLPSIGQQVRMMVDHLNGVGGCLASLSRSLAQLVDPSIIDPNSKTNATLWAELQQLHGVGEEMCQKAASASLILGAHLSTVQTLSLPSNTGPSAWGLLGKDDLSGAVSALVSAMTQTKLREGALAQPEEEVDALSLSGSFGSALGQSNRPSPLGALGQVNGILVDCSSQTDPLISIRPNPTPSPGHAARPPAQGPTPTPNPTPTPTPNHSAAAAGANSSKPLQQGPVPFPSTIKCPAHAGAGAGVQGATPVATRDVPSPTPSTPPAQPPAGPPARTGGPPPPPPLPPVVKNPHVSPAKKPSPPSPKAGTGPTGSPAASPPPAQKPKSPEPSFMDELQAKMRGFGASAPQDPIRKDRDVTPPGRARPDAAPNAPVDEKDQIHQMLKQKFANVNRGSVDSQATEWSV